MDLTIDIASVSQAVGAAAIGIIGWYIKRWAERAALREEARDSKLDTLATDFRDFKSTVTARFDGLQLAVDGHGREAEIARESRGKINARIDAQADRLTRVETKQEMAR